MNRKYEELSFIEIPYTAHQGIRKDAYKVYIRYCIEY